MLQKLNNFFLHYEKLDAKLLSLLFWQLLLWLLQNWNSYMHWETEPEHQLYLSTNVIMGTKT